MLNQEQMPGAGSVADTIEFMKKMWSSMGAPAMATPSLSVEDINKKIADLKTVASWLELNLNMLKATIQTLEVQSATLSTLQAMSAIMASRQAPADETAADEEASTPPPFPFGFPMWPGAGAAPQETPEEEPAQAAAQDVAEEQVSQAEPPPPVEEEAVVPPAPDFQSAIANPNAWWNVLQEQFKHAVGNALAGSTPDQEPLLKPAKPPKAAKRSENKTVAAKPKAPPKGKPAGASKPVKGAKPPPGKPAVKKAPKRAANTSAPARTAVVQSRQNKKPASRKPTSP
ncbi:PhaM family polyhydroxyalkanoate granule multifunctional regulatory protein [Herbaspirillum rubrisubalbicans]|uniref:Pilus assembly protein FimV n=1 Tax=Herbaspirillum rubrisubalbicans TaxID=80842 RepID=A0AAD0UAE3_9BURK|nr:PhaM family polyhydroxyalkanoate granule multifunctional regulatory protein [Herbaspirillum rubrisubalbicans]AYR26282.1 pilus assembly protein FimV [Herbaspirillum rubrisubalbicans]